MGLWDGPTSGWTLSYQTHTTGTQPCCTGKSNPGKKPKPMSWSKEIPWEHPKVHSLRVGGKQDLLLAKGRSSPTRTGVVQVGEEPSVRGNPWLPRIWADKRQGWVVPSTSRAGDGARSLQGQPRSCQQQRDIPARPCAHPCPSHIPKPPSLVGRIPWSIPPGHVHVRGKHKEQEPLRHKTGQLCHNYHPVFPGKSTKSLSRPWCKLKRKLPPYPWPQIENWGKKK